MFDDVTKPVCYPKCERCGYIGLAGVEIQNCCGVVMCEGCLEEHQETVHGAITAYDFARVFDE